MKLKSSIILVLAALWGLGSWWWYTCNIKGFCSMEATATSQRNTPNLAEDDSQDNDKDGIRNGDEKRVGTDPNNTDSDEDGVPDLVEISQIPNDTDSDGLIDALDDDDDNDSILTKDEQPDRNNDGRVDDALDSDTNGTPDYLQPSRFAINKQNDKKTLSASTSITSSTNGAEVPVVTNVVEDGSVDIYRPETQASAMSAAEEKRLNQGTPSPAPIVPEPPATVPATSTSSDSTTTASKDKTEAETKIASITNSAVAKTEPASTTTEKEPSTSKAKTTDSSSTTTESKEPDSSKTTKEKSEPTDKPDKPTKSETADKDKSDKSAKSETADKDKSDKSTKSEIADKDKSDKSDKSTKSETTEDSKVEPQDPEGKDRNKMVVYQNGKSTDTRLGPARLNFPTGLARPALTDETAEYFDTVAAYLQKHKSATIKITGHTDSRGDADLNKKLALKRAEIVRDALVRRGAPEKQLQVNSLGESKPIASNNTAEGRQQNRRVDVMPLK